MEREGLRSGWLSVFKDYVALGAGVQGVHYGWIWMEVGMSQKAFSLAAGLLFLLIAVGHALRIVFGLSLVVQGVSVTMWASAIAVVVTGYLAYEGIRLSRTSLPSV
jgi:hypothetical protein